MQLDLTPIGIKIFRDSIPDLLPATGFNGISYCDAVRQASAGESFLVKPDSIGVCQWSPIVLGFKEPSNSFERSIDGRLSFPVKGIYLAPIRNFPESIKPDVVIIRTSKENLQRIIDVLGRENFAWEEKEKVDRSALSLFERSIKAWRLRLINVVNGLLDKLNRSKTWQKFTHILFRSTLISSVFDKIIKRTMADMSMCRNSTYIPFITGKANISFFCTGGIAWGQNRSHDMTSGYPYSLYTRLEKHLSYPRSF